MGVAGFNNRNLKIENLKSLRVPIRFREAAFALVFEKFVDGREHNAAEHVRINPHVEIQFVIEKVNVSVSDHAKKISADFEVAGMSDAVLDREIGVRFVGDAVTGPGNDVAN